MRRINLNLPWQVVHGDVRSTLARIPDNSIHLIVTSPPYWGLRDYGLPETIWDAKRGCRHCWHQHLRAAKNGSRDAMQGKTMNPHSATRTSHATGFLCEVWCLARSVRS